MSTKLKVKNSLFARVFFFNASYDEFGTDCHQVLLTISNIIHDTKHLIEQSTCIDGIVYTIQMHMNHNESVDYFNNYSKSDAYEFLKEMYNAFK